MEDCVLMTGNINKVYYNNGLYGIMLSRDHFDSRATQSILRKSKWQKQNSTPPDFCKLILL